MVLIEIEERTESIGSAEEDFHGLNFEDRKTEKIRSEGLQQTEVGD